MITKFPSKNEIKKHVDTLITPENADKEVLSLITLLTTVIDLDGNEECYEAGQTAMNHAYQMTAHYENSFRDFCGQIEPKIISENTREIEKSADLLH